MKKKILAIIPARIGSKGLKKKNLRKIGGKTLVQHSIDVIRKSKYITNIAISTDSKVLKNIAKKNKIWCEKLRPKKYSTDKISTYSAIRFVIENIIVKPDIIIELHPTYIFRKASTIDKAIQLIMKNKKFDSLLSLKEINDTSHPSFMISLKNKMINYKKSPISFNRHFLSKKYKSLGYLLISTYESFIKNRSMIGKKCFGYNISCNIESLDINDKLDFDFAKFIYNKYDYRDKT